MVLVRNQSGCYPTDNGFRKMLGTNFRQSTGNSFIRQMNMYGFKKLNTNGKSTWEFCHTGFQRSIPKEQRLTLVSRRPRPPKMAHNADVNTVIAPVRPSATAVDMPPVAARADIAAPPSISAMDLAAQLNEVRASLHSFENWMKDANHVFQRQQATGGHTCPA
eukprot:Opistho-2@32701